MHLHYPIDWHRKAMHLVQTVLLCTAIALGQWLLIPGQSLGNSLLYSMAIGLVTWVVIDFGRHLFPSARAIGWPRTGIGLLLVLWGMGGGFVLGTAVGDALTGHASWAQDSQGHLLSSLLMAVLAGSVATTWFYAQGRSQWLSNEVERVRQQANEARLRLLEAQLEPHMLFNTLANLQVLVRTEPERADTMLTHLIAYLRATLDASQSTQHPLEQEFARVRDYLALMAVRMGPRLRFTLELPTALSSVPVPALVLQPLVENAIRHGLEPQIAGGTLTVRAFTELSSAGGEELVLQVLDDGVGLPNACAAEPAPSEGTGFGLRQVRERITTLYGAQASLQLLPYASGHTLAQLRWPLSALPSASR